MMALNKGKVRYKAFATSKPACKEEEDGNKSPPLFFFNIFSLVSLLSSENSFSPFWKMNNNNNSQNKGTVFKHLFKKK